MPIQNMPASLQNAIQAGFLETEFKEGLTSTLGFRAVADRETVAINVGETVTKTRAGLKAPTTTPLAPNTNTNLDNGLNPSATTIEQYTLGMDMYGDTTDLNLVTSQVGIANQFLLNSRINGTQSMQSLDRLARNALFNAYLGGNTRVRTTLGAAAATINVDDVRGFETVLLNGKMVGVTGAATAGVLVGANVYTLTAVARDGGNVSTVWGGFSGTLTFSSNVSVADGTAGIAVAHINAPVVKRGGNRASVAGLQAGDVLTLSLVEDAIADMRNNTGLTNTLFNLYLDNTSMRQLFADADFKQMYQGRYGSAEVQRGQVFQLVGANFIPTTEAIVQQHPSNAALKVRRPILTAPGALVEGDFAGMQKKAAELSGANSETTMVDGVAMVTRGPIDRLAQIVAQSWYWIGGFVAPTDVTATSQIIPTAGAQYLKRAAIIEHV